MQVAAENLLTTVTVAEVSVAELAGVALFIDLLSQIGEARLGVSGSSMLPSIWPGDVLTVRQCSQSDVHIGDIAVFTRAGRLFAHRVVQRDGVTLITQGDGVPSQDPPVGPDALLGRVMCASRNGRRVMRRDVADEQA